MGLKIWQGVGWSGEEGGTVAVLIAMDLGAMAIKHYHCFPSVPPPPTVKYPDLQGAILPTHTPDQADAWGWYMARLGMLSSTQLSLVCLVHQHAGSGTTCHVGQHLGWTASVGLVCGPYLAQRASSRLRLALVVALIAAKVRFFFSQFLFKNRMYGIFRSGIYAKKYNSTRRNVFFILLLVVPEYNRNDQWGENEEHLQSWCFKN